MVTEKKEFPAAPACPPSIETVTLEAEPENPLDRVIELNFSEEPTGDAGPAQRDLVLRFEVRDCNQSQELRARLFWSIEEGVIREAPITPPNRNPFEFELPRSRFERFAGSCQKIEVYVSEAFKPDAENETRREPVNPGDLGTATWWVAVSDTENPSVEMRLCP